MRQRGLTDAWSSRCAYESAADASGVNVTLIPLPPFRSYEIAK